LTYTDRSSTFAFMTTTKDTRQLILDTAATLFHTQSYSDVGIATVCKEAGVSKGSFFHFFPSKQDLGVAVLEQFRENINATLVAKAFSSQYPPLERIQRFVDELYRFQLSQVEQHGHLPGCPFGNIVMEQATQDEVLRAKADGCIRSITNHLRTAVADAVQSGDLPPVDEATTAEAMFSYLEGIQLMAKSRNDAEVIKTLGLAVTSIQVPLKRQ
jgi:TetR/AcrR family transcriptional repressor of nem operon